MRNQMVIQGDDANGRRGAYARDFFVKLNQLLGELLYKNSRLEGRECGLVQRR